jgi:hypothetical protein
MPVASAAGTTADEALGVTDDTAIAMPKGTSTPCERRVKQRLANLLEDEAMRRLRRNQPLSPSDLERLESILSQIGERMARHSSLGFSSKARPLRWPILAVASWAWTERQHRRRLPSISPTAASPPSK